MKKWMQGSVALLTVAASACSVIGGAAPAAQPSGPIKIGMITSLTGNYTPLGTGDKLGAQQVVDTVNAKGGINGRQITLEIVDDASDPNQTLVQLQKLIDDGNTALLGPPQSTADLAIKPVVNDKKMPIVALGASDDQVVPVTPYMWMTAPLSSQVANTCVQYMKAQGKTKVAMLTDTKNAYAVAGHDATVKALGPAGMTLVDDESFETTQTNFAPQFAKIEAAKPDYLLVWATGAPPVVITKAWANEKNSIQLMMTAAEATPLFVAPVGAAGEGVLVQASMGDIGDSIPAGNKYKTLIDAFATPFQAANKSYPSEFSWDAMVGMSFLVDAIQRKGSASEEIRAGLDSVDLDTPQGHYTFTAAKHYGMPDSSNVMAVIKGGKFVPAPNSPIDLTKAGS